MSSTPHGRRPEVHLSLNVRGMTPSPTVAINELSDRLRCAGKRVYKLGLGQSPFPVPPEVVEALRLAAPQKDYLPVKGLAALRETVAAYHQRRDGLAVTGEDVLIAPGSKELMFLLQIVYDGELVIPSPAWVSYAPQARIVGRNVRFLHTRAADGWLLDPGQLEALCREDPDRPRILILNYPSNPTGATYSPEALKALAGVAARHRIVVLSDEIYGALHHRGRHVSIARYYPEGSIVSGGLSKWCGAGGWRLGTFTFPASMRWLLDAMAAVASESYTTTSTPIQYAAVRAFECGPPIERYLAQVRRILAVLGEALAGQLAAAGATVQAPAGAFYLFPGFDARSDALAARGIDSSDELCRRLLDEAGVAVLPGSVFGRKPEELVIRLAYVDFDGARALADAETVPLDQPLPPGFCDVHCPDVLEGVERLCDWLEG